MRPFPRKNRIIRCFVSSTFVDMTLERNLLQKYIVPELKAYCRTKGWQFEVIDLRWGISAEAASHHKTMRICLNELKRCVELSPRPNFILLLGQRYGWRPIPENLPCADFNYVSARCTETEREVLHCWYQLTSDEDYQLLPCTTELTEDVYNRDEPIIRGVFDRIGKESVIDFYESYCSSATEQEIIHGVFKLSDIKDHVLCYTRQLTCLPESCREQYVENEYIDRVTDIKNKVKEIVGAQYDVTLSYEDYIADDFKSSFVRVIKEKLYDIVNREINENRHLTDEYIEDVYQSTQVEKLQLSTLFGRDNLYILLGESPLSSSATNILRSVLRRIGVKYRPSDDNIKLLETIALSLSQDSLAIKDIYLIGLENIHHNDFLRLINWDYFPSANMHKVHLVDAANNNYQTPVKNIDIEELCRPENFGTKITLSILSLIAFSPNGVNEDEIMGMLSLDDDVLEYLQTQSYHKLQADALGIIHIPYTIWSRFYTAIEDFIVCRQTAVGIAYTFVDGRIKGQIVEYVRKYYPLYEQRAINIMIRYFSKDITFRESRSTEVLPYLYYVTKQYGLLCDLLSNNDFLQVVAEYGIIDEIVEYMQIMIANNSAYKNHLLEHKYRFLQNEKSGLLKYAKLNPRAVASREAVYNSQHENYDVLYCYLNRSRLVDILEDGKAIIVSNSRDFPTTLSTILYVDMMSSQILGITIVPLEIKMFADNLGYRTDDISSVLRLNDDEIIFVTEYGKKIIWNTRTGVLLSNVEYQDSHIKPLTRLYQTMFSEDGYRSEDNINNLVYILKTDGSLDVQDMTTKQVKVRIRDKYTAKAYRVVAVPLHRGVAVISEQAVAFIKIK